MKFDTLKVEVVDQIAWVTMNRPDELNSMNAALIADLRSFFGNLTQTQEIRVVVLRGAGRAFCAGLDLSGGSQASDKREDASDGGGRGPAAGLRMQRRISEIVIMMRRAPQPIIACVQGPACGGGFALALAADVRLAGESARMNAAFIKIGLSACDIGVSYFLPRLVGASLASELLLTGRFIHADRALATGLVSLVMPDDQLEEEARKLAEEMLATAPLGLRLTKECLNMSLDAGSLEAVIAMEDRNQILCSQTKDLTEGFTAFLQKRKPEYKDC